MEFAFDWEELLAEKYSQYQHLLKSISLTIVKENLPKLPNSSTISILQAIGLEVDGEHELIEIIENLRKALNPQDPRVESFRNIPVIPPSSLAKDKFRNEFEKRFAIGRPCIPQIPVYLRTLPFLNFMKNIEVSTPNNIDLNFASDFIDQQLYLFEDDNARADLLRKSLGQYFHRTIQTYTFRTNRAGRNPNCDGIIFTNETTNLGSNANVTPLLILEVKNEIGHGGTCPYIESAGYYSLCLKNLPEHQVKFSCAPCLALTVAGPHFQISFFAAGENEKEPDVVCGENISSYINLKSTAVYEVAKYLTALRICVDELQSYYTHREYLKEPLYSLTPFIRPQNITFEISKKLFPTKLLFLCRKQTSCILKLATRYCPEAHQILADLGYAPRFHNSWEIPGTPYTAILMDFCDYSTLYEWLDTDDVTQENIQRVVEKLYLVLDALHSQGFVHGDFRSTNIMMKLSEAYVDIKVIDFDWSGQSGEVSYPFNLNPELGYYGNSGDVITPTDDRHWVQKIANIQS